MTPGGNIGFESAPFKLTAEFVELMDGLRSSSFMLFRELCVKTFLELRKHSAKIVLLLEMISHGNEHLPFFSSKIKSDLPLETFKSLYHKVVFKHLHLQSKTITFLLLHFKKNIAFYKHYKSCKSQIILRECLVS